MFGRHHEKALLDEALTGARGGAGRCVVFVGESGSGKSTLLRHAITLNVGAFRVIEVTGVETESKLLWSGLTTLVWPLRELIAQLPDAVGEPLRRLVHGDTGPTRLDPLSVGVAVLHLLSLAAERTPLMVVADDLQWLDWPTAQILRFVTRRLGEDPIVFVGAVRSGAPFSPETGSSTDWPGMAPLRGLDRDDVAALFAGMGRSVNPGVCRELADRTAGHPLALTEIAALLTEPQLLGSEPLPSVLPVSQLVRDRVATQLSMLPEPTRRALLVLSLDPTMCRPQAMRVFQAAGIDESDVGPAFAVGLATSALAGARLAHPLVRSAIVQLATEAERTTTLLHMASTYPPSDLKGLLLRAEASTGTDDVLAADLEALAHRLLVTVDAGRAVAALREAARLTSNASLRVRRRRAGAEAALATGDVDSCAALLAKARVDPVHREEAARLRIVESRLLLRTTGASVDPASLGALADEIEAEHPALAADLFIEASLVPMRFGRVMEALPYAERAVGAASRADRRVQLRAAAIRSANLVLAAVDGAIEEAMPIAEELLNLDGPIIAGPYLVETVGRALAFKRAFVELDGILDRVIHAARRNGDASALVLPLTCQALRNFSTHYPSCVAAATEAIELAERTAQPGLAIGARVILPSALAALRDDGALDRHLERLDVVTDPAAFVTRCTARAHHEHAFGRPHAALEALQPLIDSGTTRESVVPWQHDLVEAYALTGRCRDARAELDRLAVNPWVAGAWRDGVVKRLEALLVHEPDEAERLVHEAIELLDGQPSLDAARCELWWGERLRRRRRRTDARTYLERARERFVAVGATAWLDRCDRELASMGSRSEGRRSSDVVLTPRELQIARAIVSGLSLGEAGAQLFISARTVETHLAAVYRKLQVKNRAELAAFAASDLSLLGEAVA